MTSNSFLKLRIAGEAFGGRLDMIREILPLQGIARVPFTAPAVLGVINLRGNVVPVIDGALRLGKNRAGVPERRSVVIVEVEDDLEKSEVGLVVDAVESVGTLDAGNVYETPEFGLGIPPEFVLGMGRHGDELLPLLDLKAMLAIESLAKLVQL